MGTIIQLIIISFKERQEKSGQVSSTGSTGQGFSRDIASDLTGSKHPNASHLQTHMSEEAGGI